MKQLRIVIVAFIGVTVGVFLYLTAGSSAEVMLFERIMNDPPQMASMVLLIGAFTLLSTMTGLPVFYLSMALGFLLPLWPALLISWGVNLVSVMASYFMVRSAFTTYFKQRYGKKKLIRRINKRIRKYGLWTVVFSRAVYIFPTSLINFSFPLSNISTRSYLLGTLLGLIPECLLNVLTGYLIKHEVILLSSQEAQTWRILVLAAFILLFALVFILLRIRQRKKKLRKLKAIPYRG